MVNILSELTIFKADGYDSEQTHQMSNDQKLNIFIQRLYPLGFVA